jgi:hypothetical protein
MPYSYDELFETNGSYKHRLDQDDVNKVNRLVERIEARRQGDPMPMDGDKIICVSPLIGEVSNNGYLEKREGRLSVCVYPYVPFISEGSLHTNASGGPWFPFSEEQFWRASEFAGHTLAAFHVWGHFGPCAHGAVYFQAKVFLWKVTDPRFYKHPF